MAKTQLATFWTVGGFSAAGFFSVDDRQRVVLRIETADQGIIVIFKSTPIINCISLEEKYFFAELQMSNYGNRVVNGNEMFFIEIVFFFACKRN